ncbi:hypothetical protein AcV7_006108 [Taiwanofungus camphoratus]|nr:hypothetical protein AcV7_006108 [Antrodia cinnamomea]
MARRYRRHISTGHSKKRGQDLPFRTSAMSSFHRTASSSLVNLSSMQFQDENSQPRDRRPWTEEEDEKLRVAIEQEDPDSNPPTRWHAIAQHIPNRTNKDCRKRWWAQMATIVAKGSWTSDEDERLFNAVQELGPKWAVVASRVRTRNSGQCAKRWNDALNPSIDRSGWSREEDERLLKAVEEQGHSWANIARTCLPGRTGLAAKNRYYHRMRGSDRPSGSRGRGVSITSSSSRRRTRGVSVSSRSTSSVTSPKSPSLTSQSSPDGPITAPPTPESLTHSDENTYEAGNGTVEKDLIVGTGTPSSDLADPYSLPLTISPSASFSMEHQILDLFMTNTLGESLHSDATPSSSPFSHVPWTSASSISNTPPSPFGDPEQLDPFGPWPPCISGSAALSNPPVLDAIAGLSQHHDSSMGSSVSPNDLLDLQGFDSSATPEIANCLGTYFQTASQHESPFISSSITELREYATDAQVKIGNVPAYPDRARIQVMQPNTDPSDRRVVVAVAICDRQDVGSTVQSLSESLSTILNRGSSSV